jgi:hypothetical protein
MPEDDSEASMTVHVSDDAGDNVSGTQDCSQTSVGEQLMLW